MGDVSKAFGGGSSLEYNGKVFKLQSWLYRLQGDFEKYLEEHAWKKFLEQKDRLPPSEADAVRAQLMRDISTGKYTFGGPLLVESLWVPIHAAQWTYLLIEDTMPADVTPALVREMFTADPEKCFKAMWQAGADPTRTPPPAKD